MQLIQSLNIQYISFPFVVQNGSCRNSSQLYHACYHPHAPSLSPTLVVVSLFSIHLPYPMYVVFIILSTTHPFPVSIPVSELRSITHFCISNLPFISLFPTLSSHLIPYLNLSPDPELLLFSWGILTFHSHSSDQALLFLPAGCTTSSTYFKPFMIC